MLYSTINNVIHFMNKKPRFLLQVTGVIRVKVRGNPEPAGEDIQSPSFQNPLSDFFISFPVEV